MDTRFFTVQPPDQVEKFLQHFPAKEVWRFFVERRRYNYKEVILMHIHAEAYQKEATNDQDLKNVEANYENLAEIIRDVLAKTALGGKFKKWPEDKKLGDYCKEVIDKQLGWVGFEDIEPNYLAGVVNGFCFLVMQLLKNEPLNQDLIMTLHHTCTTGVKNMWHENQPGKLREKRANWRLTDKLDSIEGLKENLAYIAKVEQENNNIESFLFYITKDSTNEPVGVIKNFTEQDLDAVADYIIEENAKKDREIFYSAESPEKDPEFLQKLCLKQIEEYNVAIAQAVSKEEKLTAIFTYLKHAVLYHPFQDGVGRTYSMLLLQYLLMKENLLPVLFPDSNFIPGLSVHEMIQHYYKAEAEMKKILSDPEEISSPILMASNIDTNEILKTLDSKDQDYFNHCIEQYQKTVAEYLLQKRAAKTLAEEPAPEPMVKRQKS